MFGKMGKYRSLMLNVVSSAFFVTHIWYKYLIIQIDYFCCFDNLTRVWFQSKTGGAFSLKNSCVSKMWRGSQKEFCLNGKFSRRRKNLGPEESIWLPTKNMKISKTSNSTENPGHKVIKNCGNFVSLLLMIDYQFK